MPLEAVVESSKRMQSASLPQLRATPGEGMLAFPSEGMTRRFKVGFKIVSFRPVELNRIWPSVDGWSRKHRANRCPRYDCGRI